MNCLPLLLLGLAAAGAPEALACSCAPCDETRTLVEDENVHTVFLGELVSITRPDMLEDYVSGDRDIRASDLLYRFRNLNSLKGDSNEIIEVRSPENPASCGASFGFSRLNAVAAYKEPGTVLRTMSCIQMCWNSDGNAALFDEETFQTWKIPDGFPLESED
ncbi:MAG: hypothetical protein KDA53_18025 [Hyphomonas sp.]|nr:hypothetical protein [Hyphomonas sp.]